MSIRQKKFCKPRGFGGWSRIKNIACQLITEKTRPEPFTRSHVWGTGILLYVERGLYEYTKICLNIDFLYIDPKASKQPPITVPIITNKPVNQSYCLLIRDQQSEKAWFWGSKYILYEIPDWGARIYQVNGIGWAP